MGTLSRTSLVDGLIDPLQASACGLCREHAPPPPPRPCPAINSALLSQVGCGRRAGDSPARPLPDVGAREHTVSGAAPYVPTQRQREEVAALLTNGAADTQALYEHRDGSCMVRRGGHRSLSAYCSSFGECSGCSISRLSKPAPRERFQKLVASRAERDLRAAGRGGAVAGVRAVMDRHGRDSGPSEIRSPHARCRMLSDTAHLAPASHRSPSGAVGC